MRGCGGKSKGTREEGVRDKTWRWGLLKKLMKNGREGWCREKTRFRMVNGGEGERERVR